MVTRRVAFLAAGALWLGLGILLILTVFGPLVGIGMAYFVGLRRNVLAARMGAALGVLMDGQGLAEYSMLLALVAMG